MTSYCYRCRRDLEGTTEMKREPVELHWHSIAPEELARELETSLETGLRAEQVEKRQAEHGLNELKGSRRAGPLTLFFRQFNQPLVYILLVAVGVTVGLSEYVDAAVIFAVVLINAVIGFVQESKAEAAIEALSRMVVTEAAVLRDGIRQKMDARYLVVGDVVTLQSGDKVPADMRLLRVRELRTEEAPLTGESLPVEKRSGELPVDTVLGDRVNMAFAGTMVTYGQAEGVVVATGNGTQTGKIARMIQDADDLATPLTRKIVHLSHRLLWIILGFTALAVGAGLLHGQDWAYVFKAAVALAVGAIPEGLPAAVTITLAVGVSRMAKRHAIIRKLPAVETLGSTTVICSDKTGTLTENKMTVKAAWVDGVTWDFEGNGYESRGAVLRDGQIVDGATGPLEELLRCGLVCNDTRLRREEGELRVEGDPTEACLLVSAAKGGIDNPPAASRLDSIPFESEHQYMATLNELDGRRVVFLKGSVERMLERCDRMLMQDGTEGPLDTEAVQGAVERFADSGMRVLAFARKVPDGDMSGIDHSDVAGGLVFLGLQAMIDPPRVEVIDAVAKCHRAGILVKMITGDHALTARAIASQIGLVEPDGEGVGGTNPDSDGKLRVINGRELAETRDEDLPDKAFSTAVFARVAPEEKLRLVRALQAKKQVVAMTGDGVNDAPALKQADIGIAMGITGTDVSKGASDMILTDDNFTSIEAAVEEGRGVFDNIVKFLVWALPTNAGEGLILLAAILAGTKLPATPVQILWINMTTSVLLGLALVFERQEPGVMERPPRDPGAPLMSRVMWIRTTYVALIMLAGAFGFFVYEIRHGYTEEMARTMVVNVIVMVEMAYLLGCRSLILSPLKLGLFSNPLIFAGILLMGLAQVAFTYIPVMNRLFGSAPLPADAWLQIFAVGIVVLVVVELEKKLRFVPDRQRSHS